MRLMVLFALVTAAVAAPIGKPIPPIVDPLPDSPGNLPEPEENDAFEPIIPGPERDPAREVDIRPDEQQEPLPEIDARDPEKPIYLHGLVNKPVPTDLEERGESERRPELEGQDTVRPMPIPEREEPPVNLHGLVNKPVPIDMEENGESDPRPELEKRPERPLALPGIEEPEMKPIKMEVIILYTDFGDIGEDDLKV